MTQTATTDTVERRPESAAIRSFLERALSEPAGLVIEGEAGIGKTTLIRSAAGAAAADGFRVLATRGAPTEVQYAFAAVADLLRDIEPDVLADLPEVQRDALSAVLVLDDSASHPASERVVAAAFLSVIQRLATEAPLLLCIDDAHWLDTSSQMVIGFAARRFAATIPRIGLLAAVRTGSDADVELDLVPRELTQRLRMTPLTLGGTHKLIVARLGRALPRPILSRIYETSGGNPFFALELARSSDSPRAAGLPHTLAAVVQHHIGDADDELASVLLATACAMVPTVERVGRATGIGPDQLVELIEATHDRGLLELDGNRIRFLHPLYANGVYTSASPARRRAMHRRLAEIAAEPEIKARHLALSATTADETTLKALDAAAAVTRTRGAPAQAAEMFASVPQLKDLHDISYFKEPDDVNLALSRGDAGVSTVPNTSFTTLPLLWSPVPGEEILVVAGKAQKNAFVVAFYRLPGDRYRIASSFILKDEKGPIVLGYNSYVRRKLSWSMCWDCRAPTEREAR